jgi:ADP-dependent phosphofructokinase/glucokinase
MTSTIVLGLGSSVDYEITWSSQLIEHLVQRYGITVVELTGATEITDERSLVVSVLGHFRLGVGGEQHVASPDVLDAFAAKFDRKVTLGGTAVRAGLALSRLNVPVTLHLVGINDHFRELLPSTCAWITSAEHDSTEPHLIVQWNEGARVRVGQRELIAPFPNRLIYVNDQPNAEMLLSPDLPQALSESSIFLISGLNAMQDEHILHVRLKEIRRAMDALPEGAFVYYEDAGFHVQAFSAQVREALLDRIDVYGMNEDEMQTHLGREINLLDPDSIRHALDDLATIIPARTLVIHTKYWVLACGFQPEHYASALEGGVAMASTRYRYGDNFTPSQYAESAEWPVNQDGAAVSAALSGPGLYAIPTRALSVPMPTTIGLGDSFVGGFLGALTRNGAKV